MELVQDKEKANFCDFFLAAKSTAAEGVSESESFKKLHDLFK